MRNPTGESENQPLRQPFDPRLKLGFHGSRVTSDAGLLAYRELDDALGLTDLVGGELVAPRTGKNGQHAKTGLIAQGGRVGYYIDGNRDSSGECRLRISNNLLNSWYSADVV